MLTRRLVASPPSLQVPTMSDTATLTRPRKKSRPYRRRSTSGAVTNGSTRGHAHDSADARSEMLLAAMVAFRDGDFSVRLPTRLAGHPTPGSPRRSTRPSATTERISTRDHAAERDGRQGRAAQAAHVAARRRRRLGGEGRIVQHPHRRPGAADGRDRAHHRRGRQGRPRPVDGARGRRPRAEGRVPALGQAREHDDRAARGLHRRGDARGARGRHRGQARRPGAGEGRVGRLEGPDRLGQPDGRQPHRAGAQHRRRDDRRGQRRPLQEDHRRRPRRDPAAQGSHQHDGRSAALVRLGSDARGARGRHRRPARRPGRGAGRGRHVEGPHRLGQRDGVEPHRAGAQHRGGDHRRGPRRPLAQDHRRREGRDPRAEGNHQHDGRPAQRLLLGSDARGARGRHRGQARRPGGGARRGRHVEGPHRLRQLDGVEPHRPGAQHRRRDDRRRQGRPLAQDHRRREGRDPRAEEHHQHDGGPAQRLRLGSDARGARGRHRGQARRPGGGAAASPARGRTSPTTSTSWPPTSPARCATSPR